MSTCSLAEPEMINPAIAISLPVPTFALVEIFMNCELRTGAAATTGNTYVLKLTEPAVVEAVTE